MTTKLHRIKSALRESIDIANLGVSEKSLNRFLNKIQFPDDDGCWNWIAAKNDGGYGVFTYPGFQYAHRFMFFINNGVVQKDKMIDHVCRNRSCVNPLHLREVTAKQNSLENSDSITACNSKKKTCINGHELTTDKRGWRFCQTCKKKRRKLAYEKTGK